MHSIARCPLSIPSPGMSERHWLPGSSSFTREPFFIPSQSTDKAKSPPDYRRPRFPSRPASDFAKKMLRNEYRDKI